jgi:hypothetical protein
MVKVQDFTNIHMSCVTKQVMSLILFLCFVWPEAKLPVVNPDLEVRSSRRIHNTCTFQ